MKNMAGLKETDCYKKMMTVLRAFLILISVTMDVGLVAQDAIDNSNKAVRMVVKSCP